MKVYNKEGYYGDIIEVDINGLIIDSIEGLEENSEQVAINFTNGYSLIQYHEQDCCESVYVSQVDGDFKKFIGASVLELKEKTKDMADNDYQPKIEYFESGTATFYTLVTNKGYLDWRWQGESNGYYSEEVDIIYTKETK